MNEEKVLDPKELWEPAKPGEKLEDVWIPNRKERRRMMFAKRGKNKKAARQMGKMLQETENYAKTNPTFKQDLYKALYENLKKKTEGIEERLKKENIENGTAEGN